MKAMIASLICLFSIQAMAAEQITCTLKTGKSTVSDSVILTEEYATSEAEPVITGPEVDLGVIMSAGCEADACKADALIISQKIEDEVGDVSFEFSKSATGVVYKEKIENAPDRRNYTLFCNVH